MLSGPYDILCVESGPQALAALETHPVALLLTDNGLASVQDRRFAQSLRQDHGALPRILFASRPGIEQAIASRNGDRVDGALPSGCEPAKVVSLVNRLVGDATAPLAVRAAAAAAAGGGRPPLDPERRARAERETLPDGDLD